MVSEEQGSAAGRPAGGAVSTNMDGACTMGEDEGGCCAAGVVFKRLEKKSVITRDGRAFMAAMAFACSFPRLWAMMLFSVQPVCQF